MLCIRRWRHTLFRVGQHKCKSISLILRLLKLGRRCFDWWDLDLDGGGKFDWLGKRLLRQWGTGGQTLYSFKFFWILLHGLPLRNFKRVRKLVYFALLRRLHWVWLVEFNDWLSIKTTRKIRGGNERKMAFLKWPNYVPIFLFQRR